MALATTINIYVSKGIGEEIGQQKTTCFFDLLLKTSKNGSKLTDDDLRDHAITFIIAGYDTVSTAICFALHQLGNCPDIQDKVYTELEEIDKRYDHCSIMENLNGMKYLERVIKETLRLYPPVPLIGKTATKDMEIDGFKIPAGIFFLFSLFHIHRNPKHSPNPEKFNPDRFLPENSANKHPYAYIPFSAGTRNCIGQKYAILEMKVMLSSVLHKYKIKSMHERLSLAPHVVLTAEEGFYISISRRNTK